MKTINFSRQPIVRVNDYGDDVQKIGDDDVTQQLIDNSDLLIFNQDIIQV